MNRTITSSSNDAAKANSEPEMTPGRMSGSWTRRKATSGFAPRFAAARITVQSKPASVALTVITTKGAPKTACARMIPR